MRERKKFRKSLTAAGKSFEGAGKSLAALTEAFKSIGESLEKDWKKPGESLASSRGGVFGVKFQARGNSHGKGIKQATNHGKKQAEQTDTPK